MFDRSASKDFRYAWLRLALAEPANDCLRPKPHSPASTRYRAILILMKRQPQLHEVVQRQGMRKLIGRQAVKINRPIAIHIGMIRNTESSRKLIKEVLRFIHR